MQRLLFWSVRIFFGCLRLLPLGPARALTRGLGSVVFRLDGKHRRIGLINLEVAFPGSSLQWRKRVLQESFRRLGNLAVEISHLGSWSREALRARVGYEKERGLEHYQRARSEGKGVLFVTGHLSAWELLPAAHAAHGYPLHFVVRPLDNPRLESWVNAWRCRFGNRTIAKRQAARAVLRVLESGGDVGFLIDQNVQPREGVPVPFLGREAYTATAVAALALKTGAPVVVGFLIPGDRPDHYRIRFYPPLHFSPTGDRQADLKRVCATFNHYFEEVIRETPESWLWGHRRWATQAGGLDLYAF